MKEPIEERINQAIVRAIRILKNEQKREKTNLEKREWETAQIVPKEIASDSKESST